jgi:hypothetical protein
VRRADEEGILSAFYPLQGFGLGAQGKLGRQAGQNGIPRVRPGGRGHRIWFDRDHQSRIRVEPVERIAERLERVGRIGGRAGPIDERI